MHRATQSAPVHVRTDYFFKPRHPLTLLVSLSLLLRCSSPRSFSNGQPRLRKTTVVFLKTVSSGVHLDRHDQPARLTSLNRRSDLPSSFAKSLKLDYRTTRGIEEYYEGPGIIIL